MVNADDGGCSADVYSFSQGPSVHPTGPVYARPEDTNDHLPIRVEERLQGLLGEPLSSEHRASVQETSRRCLPGEIVAVSDSDGVLRYGKVQDEELNGGEVKVQVSKTCIRWYAVSQIHFFQAVKEKLAEGSTVGVISDVNALLARLNVSIGSSYEELLADMLRLQQRILLADEERRTALKQLQQALREKRDAEKALTCVVCLVNAVDHALIPCGHSYCSTCVKRLQGLCPVCRSEITDSAVFRLS